MSGDYARSKPAPDPYLAALGRFAIKREAAVVIEDSERGLRSAIAAGIDCIVVYNKFTRDSEFFRCSPLHRLSRRAVGSDIWLTQATH